MVDMYIQYIYTYIYTSKKKYIHILFSSKMYGRCIVLSLWVDTISSSPECWFSDILLGISAASQQKVAATRAGHATKQDPFVRSSHYLF